MGTIKYHFDLSKYATGEAEFARSFFIQFLCANRFSTNRFSTDRLSIVISPDFMYVCTILLHLEQNVYVCALSNHVLALLSQFILKFLQKTVFSLLFS